MDYFKIFSDYTRLKLSGDTLWRSNMVKAVAGHVSSATVDNYLRLALQAGYIKKLSHGKYQLIKPLSKDMTRSTLRFEARNGKPQVNYYGKVIEFLKSKRLGEAFTFAELSHLEPVPKSTIRHYISLLNTRGYIIKLYNTTYRVEKLITDKRFGVRKIRSKEVIYKHNKRVDHE